MISDNRDIKDNEFDELIRRGNVSSVRYLPSNFSHAVLQKILRLNIERARASANYQTALIAFVSMLVGIGMLAAYGVHYGFPEIIGGLRFGFQSLLLPSLGGLVLMSLIMVDGFLSSRKLPG